MARPYRTRKNRLQGLRKKLGLTKKCPNGYILRAPYKRKFSNSVKQSGYNVRHGNKVVRVYPASTDSVLVEASCVKDKGLPGKGVTSGKGIGPLHEGELSRYGYNIHASESVRRAALKKAILVYGPLGVFRKLNAVANLTHRTAPEAFHIFDSDRRWVQKNYTLKVRR